MSRQARPRSAKPRSSIRTISVGVKQSCTSARASCWRGPIHRPGLPEVIADSADGGTAAEGRNYLVTDGQRLTDVGELALQAAAVLEGDDRADQRRAQREREPVDGDGDDASCLSGGGHGLELAGGAALEADPRPRELHRDARAAPAAGHRQLVLPVTPGERRRR